MFNPTTGYGVVDQGSLEEIRECVGVVLSTRTGSLIDEPKMGISGQVLRQGGANIDELTAAVEEWEPRARTTMTAGDIIDAAQRVGITVEGEQNG
jgi:phage baseplate assembly protein W